MEAGLIGACGVNVPQVVALEPNFEPELARETIVRD